MTLDVYVKMDTCVSGYFQGQETFVVHAASSLQEVRPAEKNTKYYLVALKTTTTTKKQVQLGTRIEAASYCVFGWTVCVPISAVCTVCS